MWTGFNSLSYIRNYFYFFKSYVCGGDNDNERDRQETDCGIKAESRSAEQVVGLLRNNRDMAIAFKNGVFNIIKLINALIIACGDHDVIIGNISLLHFTV